MLKPRFELLTFQLKAWKLSDANRKVLVDTPGEAQGLAKHRNTSPTIRSSCPGSVGLRPARASQRSEYAA
jgi:hypothetical protein